MAPFHRTTAIARPVGRPTEYRPEYCEAVMQLAATEGLSLTGFAGTIGVCRNAVYEWMRAYPEFGDACARAKAMRVAVLERKLMRSRKGAETTAAIFALRNAAPDEWRDIRSVEHRHTLTVEKLTDDQLNAIAGGMSPADAGVIDAEFERTNER